MLGRAISIIDKEMRGGSLAQVSKITGLTTALNTLIQASALSTTDKGKLQALVQTDGDDDFLQQPSGAPDPKAYESHSSGILDTLEDMADKAKEMRNEAQKSEMNAKHAFELLAQSLNDALKVDNKVMAETKQAKAAAEETKATAEGDLARTQKLLAETSKALKELGADCQQKAADWEVSQKSRAEELQALTDARNIISESTGGAAAQAYGLIEVKSGSKSSDDASSKVVENLKNLGRKTDDMALTQLALRVEAATSLNSGADVFAKVRAMIQDLVEKLVAEAAA